MDDDRNNNNDERHQQEEEDVQPQITVLLTPEGQQVRSILETKPDELPQSAINKINELMNDIAAAGDFLTKVRTSIVDDLFIQGEQHRHEQQQQQHGLVKTILQKDWKKIERQYETAFRFFPDILIERKHQLTLIQWMLQHDSNYRYDLRLVSLIPLAVKLGIKLQYFDEEERGGLLSSRPNGLTPLHCIICYVRDEHTINTTDECFSAVVERLREENLLVKEDIQQYKLFGELCSENIGPFLASRFWYFIDWDPMTLSIPCEPDNGNFLPIHWSSDEESSLQEFCTVLQAGIKYYPEKLGFVFCEGIHQPRMNDDTMIVRGTPFQRACTNFGQENVMNEIMNHIAEYRSITATSTITAATTATTATTVTTKDLSLLLSAVTDETIHVDCLYILMRNDPTAGLLRLQQHFQQQQQQQHLLLLKVGGGQIVCPEINTDNNNVDSNNNNNEIAVDSSTAISTSTSLEVFDTTTITVSSSTSLQNKNNKNNSSDNDNDTQQQSSTNEKKRKQHEIGS